MPSLTPSLLADGLATLLAYLLYLFLSSKRLKAPYPPGPKQHFLFGNLKTLSSSHPWIEYMNISRDLGSPLIHLQVLGTHFIVVNDLETAQELFERRTALYSDRPRMVVTLEIAGFRWNFCLIRFGESWRACRRLFDSHFKESESRKLRSREEECTYRLLQLLMDTPEDFAKHFYFHTTRLVLDLGYLMFSFTKPLVLSLGYGIDVESGEDPYVQVAKKTSDALNKSTEGRICEIIPWAKYLPPWFPGMHWKNQAKDWKKSTTDMVNLPFEAVTSGKATKSSMASRLCEDMESEKESKVTLDMIKDTVATLFVAGTDTTSTMLKWLLVVSLIFPHVQKKAQQELDSVVGRDRLPEFKDMPNLPYLQAFTKELIRWTCFTPLVLPHAAVEDDIWVGRDGKSYLIPGGAIVLGNAWAMCRDPNIYPDPDNFVPERFLTKEGTSLNPNARDPDVVFGFRSRHCPGRWMAEDVGFISAACIFAVFNILPFSEQDVWKNDINAVSIPELVLDPKPFKCKIVPRHDKVEGLIGEAQFQA